MADDVIASADCKPPDSDFVSTALHFGSKNIAVTHGENNITWTDGTNSGTIMPPQVKAIDTLGAGDVFHGAYCYFKYVRGLSFVDSLKNAADVASISVQYVGPRAGVEEYLKCQNR
jgi:sugar/nucleoside kinase (ribokinase family)